MFNSRYRIHQRAALLLSLMLLGVSLLSFTTSAWRGTQDPLPSIDAQACVYDATAHRLVIKGAAFPPGLGVTLETPNGPLAFNAIQSADATTLYVEGLSAEALQNGVTITLTTRVASVRAHLESIPTVYNAPGRPAGGSANTMPARDTAQTPNQLTAADVQQIIAQAVAQAEANNLKASIAVVDAEGNVLGVFAMTGAPATTRVGAMNAVCPPVSCAAPPLTRGLAGVCVPACAAAIAKAVTGSFLSSQGHAFSTRTASFIVQEHFPPGVNFQGSGPLFGVQFSQLLCSDVNPRSALGLSADAGGLPLYKNGVKAGGIGIEGDCLYGLDPNTTDSDVTTEELAALAGTRGFEPSPDITGDKIIVNGIRFPYANTVLPPALTVKPFSQLAGTVDPCLILAPNAVRGGQPSDFVTATVADAPAGRINKKLFPAGVNSFGSTPDLSRDEVVRILAQAAKQAFITRAAIRQPLNSPAEVNITVVDTEGNLLGIFSTADAPIFGFDVSAQKARTAAFFSNAQAGARLRAAGLTAFADAAARDGVRLDGSVAISDRAVGFLARPFYPDGIDNTLPGPFSVPIADFSPFNVGLQLEAVRVNYFEALLKFIATGDAAAGADATTKPCGNPLLGAAINNGFQIFPGSVPLYKGNKLVGAIGISGDGVDQDDLISAMGSAGFEAPDNVRSDQVMVRGTRLPYVKFPRNPNRQ